MKEAAAGQHRRKRASARCSWRRTSCGPAPKPRGGLLKRSGQALRPRGQCCSRWCAARRHAPPRPARRRGRRRVRQRVRAAPCARDPARCPHGSPCRSAVTHHAQGRGSGQRSDTPRGLGSGDAGWRRAVATVFVPLRRIVYVRRGRRGGSGGEGRGVSNWCGVRDAACPLSTEGGGGGGTPGRRTRPWAPRPSMLSPGKPRVSAVATPHLPPRGRVRKC